ncbi:hypothetical protein ACNKHS_15480 [Shigella flexneri]
MSQGPTIWSRDAVPGYGTVARWCRQERFLRHGRQVQDAVYRFRHGDALAMQRFTAPLYGLSRARVIFGVLPSSTSSGR